MAIPGDIINLFPPAGAIPPQAALVLLAVGLLTALALGVNFTVRVRRRRSIRRRAVGRGLCPESAQLVARLLHGENARTAIIALRSAPLLRERLVAAFKRCKRAGDAERFADASRRLLAELDAAEPGFPGAPLPFDVISLTAAQEPDSPVIAGWIVQIDDRSLSVVTFRRCPWPIRTELVVTRRDAEAAPFRAVLLLRPVPGGEHWVVSHDLARHLENRRRSERIPVSIRTWALPMGERLTELRDRLRYGDRVDLPRLRKAQSWARRHNITIDDLSPDGAQMTADHEVARGQRFHLVIPHAHRAETVIALPLAEVVSVRSGPGGRLVAGMRFCAMRMKERTALADYVRAAAAERSGTMDAERVAARDDSAPVT